MSESGCPANVSIGYVEGLGCDLAAGHEGPHVDKGERVAWLPMPDPTNGGRS